MGEEKRGSVQPTASENAGSELTGPCDCHVSETLETSPVLAQACTNFKWYNGCNVFSGHGRTGCVNDSSAHSQRGFQGMKVQKKVTSFHLISLKVVNCSCPLKSETVVGLAWPSPGEQPCNRASVIFLHRELANVPAKQS